MSKVPLYSVCRSGSGIWGGWGGGGGWGVGCGVCNMDATTGDRGRVHVLDHLPGRTAFTRIALHNLNTLYPYGIGAASGFLKEKLLLALGASMKIRCPCGFRVWRFGFRVPGFGFRVSVSGSGFRGISVGTFVSPARPWLRLFLRSVSPPGPVTCGVRFGD